MVGNSIILIYLLSSIFLHGALSWNLVLPKSNLITPISFGSTFVSRASSPLTRRNKRIRASALVMRAKNPGAYSSSDWVENVQKLPQSRLLKSIENHLFFNTGWASLVAVLHGITPLHFINGVEITSVPHSIMASALALMLAFRNNNAYERFVDARVIWGSVTNTSRNLARLAHVSLGYETESYMRFLMYLRVFPYLLKQHLQDIRNDDEVEFAGLPDYELQLLQQATNPPLFAAGRMTQLLMKEGEGEEGAPTDTAKSKALWVNLELQEDIGKLIDALGGCERILTTPVPRSYSRHLSRFLTAYLFTLPLILVAQSGYWTPLIVGTVSWGLLSIEAISYYIEQPFSVDSSNLRMDNFCARIATDVKDIRDLQRFSDPMVSPEAYKHINNISLAQPMKVPESYLLFDKRNRQRQANIEESTEPDNFFTEPESSFDL